MTVALPPPIAAYFAADKSGIDAVVECFTEDAVVVDEGHTYRGAAAIRSWKEGTTSKYLYTTTPFASEEVDGRTIVSSHLVGNFPGSPVDVRYFFTLAGGRIAALTIGG